MPCETATENEGVARERLCKGSSSRQAVKVIDQCKRSEVQKIKRKEERGKRKEERERQSMVLYKITHSSDDLRRSPGEYGYHNAGR